MTSKILLENLKIYAYHGVLPEENIIGTYYILNVELHADLWKATETDDLNDTISYADINDLIHAEMKIKFKIQVESLIKFTQLFRKLLLLKLKSPKPVRQ